MQHLMSNNSFIFISGHHRSDQERKVTERKARSHTARINKRHRQGLLYCGTVDTVANEESSTSTEDEPKRRPCRVTGKIGPLSTKHHAPISALTIKKEYTGLDDHAVPTVSTKAETSRAETAAAAPLRRSVSPTLGAPTTNTFMLGSSNSDIAQATDYCESSCKRPSSTTLY